MFSVRGLVERLRLFERNRVPLNLKVLGLSEYCRVSKTAIWKWIVKMIKNKYNSPSP